MVACLIMGFGANLPLGLAPGMGLNAYFTYNVVGFRGTGSVEYRTALAAIFVEGVVFVILALTGARAKFVSYFPKSIMQATAVGIGLFLCHIGFQGAEGLGIVTFEPATLVTLGGCRVDERAPMYIISDPESVCDFGSNSTNLPPASPNYACQGDKFVNPAMWLGLSGLAIMAILMVRNVKGAVMIGIIFVTAIAWIPDHGASYLKEGAAIDGGEARWREFKKVVDTPTLSKIGGEVFDGFKGIDEGDFWVAFGTFLYVDFLDTTGTLFSMATYLSNYIPRSSYGSSIRCSCLLVFRIVILQPPTVQYSPLRNGSCSGYCRCIDDGKRGSYPMGSIRRCHSSLFNTGCHATNVLHCLRYYSWSRILDSSKWSRFHH
eukprot:TRINITY_DN43364_c0_g1_i3.p1 TRINITY_DN43364_c0_g1~~TRINITY_DN43364_c0_g1_i3.p1  ORF type:complete len:376 (+),score=25.61 TRINITY_DN43364_c0_g1_i3:131-1258(+)